MNDILPLIFLTLIALGEGAVICYLSRRCLKQIDRLSRTETERVREEHPLSSTESPRQTKMNEWKYGKKE